MRVLYPVAVAAISLSSLIGCGSAHPVAVKAPGSRAVSRLVPCRAQDLALRPGPWISAMTGEHAIMYTVKNHGHARCTVKGYPVVVLYDSHGAALPFRYGHGGEYETGKKPATVILAPGASGYLLVAKYRCDLGIVITAISIRVTVPIAGGAFTGREAVGGGADLSYCRGGPHDPGQIVDVTPIEPTPAATTPF